MDIECFVWPHNVVIIKSILRSETLIAQENGSFRCKLREWVGTPQSLQWWTKMARARTSTTFLISVYHGPKNCEYNLGVIQYILPHQCRDFNYGDKMFVRKEYSWSEYSYSVQSRLLIFVEDPLKWRHTGRCGLNTYCDVKKYDCVINIESPKRGDDNNPHFLSTVCHMGTLNKAN